MAKGQGRGIGSLTVWMILFVGLWLTSTVVLVILYTGQEELRGENARLAEDNQKLISQSERRSLALFQEARKGGPTVVGLLEGARSATAQLATGVDSDDAVAIGAKLDDALRTIRSDDTVPDSARYADIAYDDALTMLYAAFGSEHALRIQAEDRVTQLEAEVATLAQANTQEKSGFEKRAREIGDQLADVEADRSRYRGERDSEVARIEKAADELRKQHDADLTEERQRSASLEGQVAQFQQRTRALQEKFAPLMIGPKQLVTARRPDGHILMARPGDDVVYITLGRNDRLVLGLRFAVYSSEKGNSVDNIPPDGRAKAQIRVVSIEDNSAQCEIVDLDPNEVILEGDLIANPIYDRNRAMGFLVAGEFDLDHDGVSDVGGALAVEALITNWGGTVSAELNALTDFVVLGRAPRRPRTATDASSGPLAERRRRLQQAYDRYNSTVESAKTLAVTVLPQEVFLSFLGYAPG